MHTFQPMPFDLVEFNPLFDKEKKTEKLAVSILKKCI